ncbi:MAG: hypothetical protein D6757_08760 [Alphaproteobacteria bacterium]|nr:MAG: hypothetical protein D6757_08760 [Alphaproteobacteria bacterium]
MGDARHGRWRVSAMVDERDARRVRERGVSVMNERDTRRFRDGGIALRLRLPPVEVDATRPLSNPAVSRLRAPVTARKPAAESWAGEPSARFRFALPPAVQATARPLPKRGAWGERPPGDGISAALANGHHRTEMINDRSGRIDHGRHAKRADKRRGANRNNNGKRRSSLEGNGWKKRSALEEICFM